MASRNEITDCCCAYCERAVKTVNENEMLCTKKGIVYSGGKCRKFLYDPQKRIPARLPPPVLEIEEEEGLSENAPPSVPPQ